MTYKVSISSGNDTVIFQASSPVSEARSATYDGFSLIHLPTDLWTYKNTSARHFGVTGKLVSRNADEAAANSRYVDLIRSWVLPDFGSSGATPPIVSLSAYYNTNITNVPCLIRSYSITFPDDVDWIFEGSTLNSGSGNNKTVGSSAMPVVCIIQVDLEEIYSAQQITAKAWKINLSKGGSFVPGSALNDVTGAGGGQWIAQQPMAGTPSMVNLTNSPDFSGIMANIVPPLQSPLLTPSPGNGNLSSTFGVASSGLILQSTKSSATSGYDLNSVSALTVQSLSPPPVPVVPSQTLIVNRPISPQ